MSKLNLSTILLSLLIAYSHPSFAIDDNDPLVDILCLGPLCKDPLKEDTAGGIQAVTLDVHHAD
ncbi:MAG: hypothetical protein COW15_14385 [Shewanella sp. CG12_big_fil_rev_8_21_14_0_65_47_15]|nr:MAG: hypothetical protein COW15_14385 [Shewanella sp. CG12_big_fil_rev_8_21_14_0_65_47_15]